MMQGAAPSFLASPPPPPPPLFLLYDPAPGLLCWNYARSVCPLPSWDGLTPELCALLLDPPKAPACHAAPDELLFESSFLARIRCSAPLPFPELSSSAEHRAPVRTLDPLESEPTDVEIPRVDLSFLDSTHPDPAVASLSPREVTGPTGDGPPCPARQSEPVFARRARLPAASGHCPRSCVVAEVPVDEPDARGSRNTDAATANDLDTQPETPLGQSAPSVSDLSVSSAGAISSSKPPSVYFVTKAAPKAMPTSRYTPPAPAKRPKNFAKAQLSSSNASTKATTSVSKKKAAPVVEVAPSTSDAPVVSVYCKNICNRWRQKGVCISRRCEFEHPPEWRGRGKSQ